MPPGNGAIASGNRGDRLRRRFGCGERRLCRPSHQNEIAAADRALGEPGGPLADELPVHHRDAPEMAAADALRDLPAVAEVAQPVTELEGFGSVEPGVTGRAGAGEHALSDPVEQLLLQLAGRSGAKQNAHAGTAIRRCLLIKVAVDARLDAAGDDGGGEPGRHLRRATRPARARRGDHDRGRAHVERLGEGVVDPHAVARHVGHGTVSAAAITAGGTSNAVCGRP